MNNRDGKSGAKKKRKAVPMHKWPSCNFCGLAYHPLGIASHEKRCKSRWRNA